MATKINAIPKTKTQRTSAFINMIQGLRKTPKQRSKPKEDVASLENFGVGTIEGTYPKN